MYFLCGLESLYNAHVGAQSQYQVSFTAKAISHWSGLDAKICYLLRLQKVLWLLIECSMDIVLDTLQIEKSYLGELCLMHTNPVIHDSVCENECWLSYSYYSVCENEYWLSYIGTIL